MGGVFIVLGSAQYIRRIYNSPAIAPRLRGRQVITLSDMRVARECFGEVDIENRPHKDSTDAQLVTATRPLD